MRKIIAIVILGALLLGVPGVASARVGRNLDPTYGTWHEHVVFTFRLVSGHAQSSHDIEEAASTAFNPIETIDVGGSTYTVTRTLKSDGP